MIPVCFCIPGDLALPTGGYRYDREILVRLATHGVQATHLALGGGYPDPSADDLKQTVADLQAIDRRSILLVDGLAAGAMPPDLLSSLPHRVVALVHHPLGLEAGLSDERAAFLLANEKAVLKGVRHVIVTSSLTAKTLEQDFAVPRQKITVAEPGTERASRAIGTERPVQILAVGAVTPRKAFDSLVAALAPLQPLDWHLTIAGSLERSREAVTLLKEVIRDNDLDSKISLAGEVDDMALEALYARSDIFAMSSLYEGYGMALAEALAHGLPIVTTTGGAAAETVPDAAAFKVPPGDVALLSNALQLVINDKALRQRMGDAAWAAGALLPTWDDTAREIADALKAVL